MTRLRRLSWGVVDQVLVSLCGAVVSVQGALMLPVAQFGVLATVLAVFYLALAGSRALVAEVYTVRYAGDPARIPATAPGLAQQVVLRLSVVLSAVLVGVAVLALPAGSGRGVLITLAVVLPLLLAQDLRRAVLIAAARTRRSALSSGVMLAGQVLGGVVLQATGRGSAGTVLLVWGCGAALSILTVRTSPVGRRPSMRQPPGGVRGWLVDGRAYWPRFLTEAVAQAGAGQLPLLLVAAVAGSTLVGGIRAAALVLCPVVVVHQAVAQMIVAEAARVRRALLARFSAVAQLGFLGLCAGWLAVVEVLPHRWLALLVGPNLTAALAALPGLAVFYAANLMITAPAATMRVTGHVQVSVTTRLLLAPLLIGLPTALALHGGSVGGVAAGFGAFGAVAVGVWNVVSRRVLAGDPAAARHRPSRHRRTRSGDSLLLLGLAARTAPDEGPR